MFRTQKNKKIKKTRLYNSTGLGLIFNVKCKKVEKRSGGYKLVKYEVGKITLKDMFSVSYFTIIELN